MATAEDPAEPSLESTCTQDSSISSSFNLDLQSQALSHSRADSPLSETLLVSHSCSDSAISKTSNQSVCHSCSNTPRYDFTLWYDEQDEPVAEELRIFLEEKNGLKGFIEERDFVIGADVFHNIDHGIDNSNKIIVILSQHSLNSSWFERKVHQSIAKTLENPAKKFNVIPIYVDIKKTDSPSVLKTVTGVNYKSPYFWKKLTNTMGIVKHGIAATSTASSGSHEETGSVSSSYPTSGFSSGSQ